MSETEVSSPTGRSDYIGAIYAFRAEGSAEFRYVGLTTSTLYKRMQAHFKKAQLQAKFPFYDWLRKQDKETVLMQPLEVVRTSLEDLGEAERKWIAKLRGEGHRLLNLAEGGLGPRGYVWTEEQRKAAGDRARGRPTGVHLYGPDNPRWGQRHTDELKAKWSIERTGSITGEKNPNFGKFGPAHPSFGRVLSGETKKRLSEQKRGELNPNFGKTASPETRAKLSAARKGQPMPSSIRSAHTRYHTNKGVFKETCIHCVADAAQERESE